MRHRISVGMGVLLLFSGCNNWFHRPEPANTGGGYAYQKPRADQLVDGLNRNAQRVQTLECRDMDIQVHSGMQTFNVMGRLTCQKSAQPNQPIQFRMQAMAAGHVEADFGSNEEEFWWWIARDNQPYLYHCSYAALQNNKRIQLPFQPEWLVEGLGISVYDPTRPYEVRENPRARTIELVERTTSPQGQPVQKVTIFAAGRAASGDSAVIGHRLLDANGKEICSTTVEDTMVDRATGARLPRIVNLSWPEAKMQLKLTMRDIHVNGRIESPAELFTRQNLTMQSVDVARGTLDPPAGQVQRVGGAAGAFR